MNLQQFRKKYPQYDDWSDSELTDSLYEKYYSDMPREQFNQSIGYSGKSTQQPSQPQQPSFADKLAESAPVQTVLGMGDSLNNFARQTANMVMPQSLQAPMANNGEGLAYSGGKVLGDIGSFAAGGEALGAARAGAESLPLVGKLAEQLGQQGLSGIARRGLGSAAYGAVQSPEDRGKGAEHMGATSLAVDALLGGASKVAPLLNPLNHLKSELSTPELLRNLKITEGTHTGLGDVIGSPYWKQEFENKLTAVSGSGADQKLAENAHRITEKGNNIFEKYLGNTPTSDINNELKNSLVSSYKKQQDVKNKLYDEVSENANNSGLKIKLDNFSGTVNKYKDQINNQNFLNLDPESKNMLNRLSKYSESIENLNYENPNRIFNVHLDKPEKIPNFSEMNILSGKLSQLAKQYKSSIDAGDRHQSKILGQLSSSIKGDIRNSIEQSGNKDLLDKYNNAEENYKKNFSPFLDKNVYQYISGQKDPETMISTFIKTGKNTDRSNLISKIAEILPKSGKDLLKASYLSRALRGAENERSIDPTQVKNLWSDTNLGQNQKKALFPDPKERQKLDEYSDLVKMNDRSFKTMYNPQTGFSLRKFVQPAATHGIGSYAGYHLGGIPGMITANVAFPAVSTAYSKALTEFLSSQHMRNKVIHSIIDKRTNNSTGGISQELQDALRNLLKPSIYSGMSG